MNYTRLLDFFQSQDGYRHRLATEVLANYTSLGFRLDRRQTSQNLPFENDITIYKESKLKLNHQGCSNALSKECTPFHRFCCTIFLENHPVPVLSRDFGNDGRNYTVKSRFPCFYTPSSSNAVAAYFDLANSNKIYLVMLWVPMIIFCTSCFFCVLCSYLVIVDKKGKTRVVPSVDPQI